MARRFANAYCDNPPGLSEHELIVVVNGGGKITPRQERLFDPLVPTFLYHDNSGKDIGAFRMAARTIPADLMIFLGGPVRPARAGWLDRIVRVYEDCGPALFGNFCFHEPVTHVRTTVWWCPPEIVNSHTLPIHNDLRYEFEHGTRSITRHTQQLGFPVLQVTWKQVCPVEHWHYLANEECLFLDQFTDTLGYK